MRIGVRLGLELAFGSGRNTQAIFAALSWLGLIATVPNGVEKKISSSPVAQYLLMIIAGIPLIEIGLSSGGSVGLRLSMVGSNLNSLTANLVSWKIRLLGYMPLGLFGLFSFGTNATLTIQQFQSIPAITWLLLPSATLGIDLINIFAATELWDQVSMSISVALNKDKNLFIKYQKFLESLVKKIEETPEAELCAILIKLEPIIQDKIRQLVPSMENKESIKFIEEVIKQLHSRLLETQAVQDIESQPYSNQERKKNESILFNWENLYRGSLPTSKQNSSNIEQNTRADGSVNKLSLTHT